MHNEGINPKNITTEMVEAIRRDGIAKFRIEMDRGREEVLETVESMMVFMKENAPHIGAVMLVAIAHPGEVLVDRGSGRPVMGLTASASSNKVLQGYLSTRGHEASHDINPSKSSQQFPFNLLNGMM